MDNRQNDRDEWEREQHSKARSRPISELLRDAQETPPEVSKFDSLVFTATVSAAGALTASVPLVRVPSDFDFSCYGMRGWCQNYGTLTSDIARVTFNIRESGRNKDLFTSDQNLAVLVTENGPANDMIFPERTLLRAGAELQPRFTFAAGWAVAEARLMGFVLFGQMIAKGIGRR